MNVSLITAAIRYHEQPGRHAHWMRRSRHRSAYELPCQLQKFLLLHLVCPARRRTEQDVQGQEAWHSPPRCTHFFWLVATEIARDVATTAPRLIPSREQTGPTKPVS